MISFDPHNNPEGREGKHHDSHWPQWKPAQEEGRPARVTWRQVTGPQMVLCPGLEPWPSAWTSHGPLPGPPPFPGQARAKGQAKRSEKPSSHFPNSLWSPKNVASWGATLLSGSPRARPSWASLSSASAQPPGVWLCACFVSHQPGSHISTRPLRGQRAGELVPQGQARPR